MSSAGGPTRHTSFADLQPISRIRHGQSHAAALRSTWSADRPAPDDGASTSASPPAPTLGRREAALSAGVKAALLGSDDGGDDVRPLLKGLAKSVSGLALELQAIKSAVLYSQFQIARASAAQEQRSMEADHG